MAGEANIWNPRTLIAISADTKRVEERLTASAAQQLFTITDFVYVLSTGALEVHKNGLLLAKGTDWTEQTDSTFFLSVPASSGDQIIATGHVGITGDVDVRDTDIFISNYQAIRDYSGTEITLYAQGQVTAGDEGEHFFQKITGQAPGFFVDDNINTIVPTGGNGSIGWIKRPRRSNDSVTLAAGVADKFAYPGKVVYISDRSNESFTYKLSQTPNTFNIVVCTGVPALSLVLDNLSRVNVDSLGNDASAVQHMASLLGYVRIGSEISLTTTTIDVPLIFTEGAFINAQAANTITITNTIESTRQHIFQGDGSYQVDDDSDSGENSRMLHASWFGVFPVNTAATDMATNLNKLLSSLGTDREAIVDFDIGRYPLGANVSVPRATWLRCSASRRTIFEILDNGFDVFTPTANGCRFTGMQFELSAAFPTTFRTSGYYINSNQQLTELEDVWVGNATQNILLSGGKSEARKISATFDEVVDVGAGSAVINVEASDCEIDGVKVISDGLGPRSLVNVGGLGVNNISEVNVSKLRFNCQSMAVSIEANSKNVNGVNVSDIAYRGITGFEAADLIELSTSGTGVLKSINLSNVVTNEKLINLLKLSESGISMSSISLSDVKSKGTGIGINLIETSGSLSGVTIDQTVELSSFATAVLKSGSMTDISVSPVADPGTNFGKVYDFNISDDSVVSIPFSASVFTGIVMVSVTTTEFVTAVFRTASAAQILEMDSSANAVVTTGVLTGTTGVDGQFTIGAATDVLYFENRLGGTRQVNVTVLAGAK